MNTDDLRQLLSDDADGQPPASVDFDAGVARKVRRNRMQAALIGTPFAVALLLVAAVLVARGSQETTVATAGDTHASTPAAPGTTSATTRPTTTTVAPPTTVTAPANDPAGPAPTDAVPTTTTAPAPTTTAAPPVNGACGTVTVGMATTTIDTAPFTCFMKAFNADVPADLTVVMNGPDGGSITDHVANAAGHVLTVSVDGSITTKLPSFSFGGGGGVIDTPPAAVDCGTITLSQPAPGAPPALDTKAMQCLMTGFMKGGAVSATIVVNGPQGGAITIAISVSADHVLTVTMSGAVTMQAPAGFAVPEDVINAIPPNGIGIDQIMGGMGTFGGAGKPHQKR